jgi:MFS family permease
MWAQIVLFAKAQYAATDAQIGLLFSAGGIGVVVLSLAAGPLRHRWSFGVVALGSLMLGGILTVAMAVIPWYGVAVVLWAMRNGLGTLFNINTGSLRQAIVPEHLLGRIRSVAGVLAWSANPLGALAGAYAIERTGDVALVYGAIGVLTFLIPLYFFLFSPLGRAERYLTPAAEPTTA